MSNSLLTEISRINEIMNGVSKSLLNEGVLGQVFKNIAEVELQKIIRAEIRNAIKAGAKDANAAARNSAKSIESNVLKKTGLKTLTGPQKNALRVEAATMAKKETAAAAKQTVTKTSASTAKKTASKTASRAGTTVSKGSSQNINRMVQNLTINLGNDVKAAIKGPVSKTAKTAKGGTKRLSTKSKLGQAEIEGLNKAVQGGTKEQLEQGLKKGWTWKRAAKWAAGIGLGIGTLWLLTYFMSSDAVPIPEDTPPNPEPTPNPQPNPQPSRWRDCQNEDYQTYGCKSTYIQRVQECLGGLKVDGIWGRNTNARLENLGYASGFKNTDVELICSKAKQTTPEPTPTPGTSERGKEGTTQLDGDAGAASSSLASNNTGGYDPNSMD